jgi:hypothetical protein
MEKFTTEYGVQITTEYGAKITRTRTGGMLIESDHKTIYLMASEVRAWLALLQD